MSDGSAHASASTVDWKALIRRGWAFVLIGLVLGAAAGYFYAKSQKQTWQATAAVFVQATGAPTANVANSRTNSEVNLDTEAKLVTSTRVLTLARDALKLPGDPSVLASKVTVTVPPNSQLLSVAFNSDSAAGARNGANAVANAYLADRAATARLTITNAESPLTSNLTRYQNDLNSLNAQIAALPQGDPRLAPTQARRSTTQGQIRTLTNQLTSLRNIVVTPGRVSSTASPPSAPSGPAKVLDVASGAAVGLVVGFAAAWLWTRKVRRIRRSADVAAGIGLPVIGRIRGLRVGDQVTEADAAAQDYRRLANVVSATLPTTGGLVVVAGCDDSAAASTVSANLAATLLRAGETVSILRAGVHDDGEAKSGGPVEIIDGIGGTKKLLPTAGPRTRRALAQLRQEGGYVVADVPDPVATADGQALGASADAVILVIRNRATVHRVSEVLAQFDAVSAPILGAVLVTVDRTRTAPRTALPDSSAAPTEKRRYGSLNGARRHARAGGQQDPASDPADASGEHAQSTSSTRGSSARAPRRRLRDRPVSQPTPEDQATPDGDEVNRALTRHGGREGAGSSATASDGPVDDVEGVTSGPSDRRGLGRSRSRIRLR